MNPLPLRGPITSVLANTTRTSLLLLLRSLRRQPRPQSRIYLTHTANHSNYKTTTAKISLSTKIPGLEMTSSSAEVHAEPASNHSMTTTTFTSESHAETVVEPTDYTNWSRDALIARAVDLEKQMLALQQKHQMQQHLQQEERRVSSTTGNPAGEEEEDLRAMERLRQREDLEVPLSKVNKNVNLSKKQKPGKNDEKIGRKDKAIPRAPKPFDIAKYNTRRIALKFAYLGQRYNGFEHHVGNSTPLPTVEEMLWRALRKTMLIFPQFPNNEQNEMIGTEGNTRDGEVEWTNSQGWHPWSGTERKEQVCWEGCEYSKCGRTDRGVSAFGQVIGLKVRSSRPKEKDNSMMTASGSESGKEKQWDAIRDELPYIQLLNRVLPPDIRVFAWCPNPPADFSARFSCRERRYRYFFTNPGYIPLPRSAGERSREGWLDLGAMQRAAKKLEGLHDFRNFCKIDPSKQITNFERRIFYAGIHQVTADGSREVLAEQSNGSNSLPHTEKHDAAQLYFFEVRGSAFLWHQVRHMVAIMFLVGQGYESPEVVDNLLDTVNTPACPAYEMASDTPLVLWDCIFPDLAKPTAEDHADIASLRQCFGHEDSLEWTYVGDENGGRDPARRTMSQFEDGKYGRNGIMEDLWVLWRKRRIDEVLAGSLMNVVARLNSTPASGGGLSKGRTKGIASLGEPSTRVFDGGDAPISVGKYVPVMKRKRKESAEVMNARYAARKGLNNASRTPNQRSSIELKD